MGNKTQNPGQNPNQKAAGQDDKTRRDTHQTNPNDANRQRMPGSKDNESDTRKQMQDK